jgi:RNA polymerase-binding transcription factor
MTSPAASTPPERGRVRGAARLRLVPPVEAAAGLDLEAVRRRLTEVAADLQRSLEVLGTDRQQNPLVADYPQDPADSGTNLAESDRTEAMLTAARARSALVADAFRRLDDGSYGRCVDCGNDVPAGRLEAKPEAARCLACQAKQDRLRR